MRANRRPHAFFQRRAGYGEVTGALRDPEISDGAGALTLELREAEPAGLVAACLRGLQAEAGARRIRLEARVAGDAIAWCAPDQVQRVLLNLVTNALRHTPSDSSIAVLVEPHPRGLQVTVEDTGDGLAPEAQRRMFERFWRGDLARTTGKAGAGLGLTIARGLVEAQGGQIWAEPRAGGERHVERLAPSMPRGS